MKRKTLVNIHIIASACAMLTIGTFFILSFKAELAGDWNDIKSVKQGILFALPILIIAMPAIAISGNMLAGDSGNPNVMEKKRRMKIITMNGIILICLAIFLYYQSHFRSFNNTFLFAQIAELVFGLGNLILIGLNARTGLKLSGRIGFEKLNNAHNKNHHS